MNRILSLALAMFSATPVMATGTFDEHKNLYNAIRSVGVTIKINDRKRCQDGRDGSYHSLERILVICQDTARLGQRETDWTDNDLDTLRHEAHHLIQDCAYTGIGDAQLAPYFTDRQDLSTFVQDSLGVEEANRLMNLETYRNSSDRTKWIEMEAFATAKVISPSMIAEAVLKECK